jgi:hypothetical protein
MDQNRKSRMEQAEGSREKMRGKGSSVGDRLRETERTSGSGSEKSGGDLGTSSDRAMWEGEGSRSSGRGMGSSRERNRSGSSGERGGGITNRGLDTEQQEQEQLPERGRSQSER